MNLEVSFGSIVKERRNTLGLTQAELGRRVGCASITIRKIEADALRPSAQIAEHLAVALNIPEAEHLAFIRLARAERDPSPLPTPQPIPEEIGQEDLSGRAIRGFALGERIGTGGYGVVYRARQATVDREVAVKIILPKFADRPEFIRRFETEAQLVARLEHPHIVPLYDYWREPSAAYLVMRLLRGGSLETALKNGPLETDVVLRLMEQLCAGLYTAHRAGVIHRDIKPANILLDDDGNAYLADFGIAKHIDNGNGADATMEGTVIGSPAYISPEQIMAEPVKPQTDIYSLGVVLYELLTGHKPFKGPTPYAYIQQHLSQPLPLLATPPENGPEYQTFKTFEVSPGRPRTMSTSGQAIPTALDIVIARATAKDAQARYPDILTMLADLRQAVMPGSSVATFATAKTKEQESLHVAEMLGLPDLGNPYKGLRSFSEADAADFFGRETLIQELLARLADTGDLARFLAVVGPSGSGKSSVVRAGLIPALRQGGLPDSDSWFITEMLPGRHPFEELEAALLRVAINPPESLLAQLRDGERGLLRATRRILPPTEDIDLVLVIDQFEEVFTLVEDEPTRSSFLSSLVTAVLEPDSRLRLIITLRADFIDQPLRYVDFGELVRQRTEFVLPLTPDELEQAIVAPTEGAGLALEPGLVQTIIREIGDQPGMLPLLQYALTELFERRSGRLLTLNAYRNSGGVLGALARRADELYEGLDQTGQELTRQLFLRLVTLGEGTEDTRRRVLQSELIALSGDEEILGDESQDNSISNHQSPISNHQSLISQVINLFGRYRLLTFDHDPVTRGPTIEVAHEALLREWKWLREWLVESRTDVRLQRLLALAAAEWSQANRDPGFLLRGARLDQFEDWADQTNIALTYEERTFLRTSQSARRARRADEEIRQKRELETAQKLAETEHQRAIEQSRSARRFRWLAAGLALFLVAAIAAAWFAFNQQGIAQANFITAERIRLAAQAQIALDNGEGGDLPALLALHSLQLGYSPEADGALLNALSRGFVRQQYLGHTDFVWEVAYSRDGRYVLTASHDGTARLWDAQSGQELNQFTIGSLVNSVSISPDGDYVLTASSDEVARLWDAQTGQELHQFTGHNGGVWSVDFSPDGQSIVTSDNQMIRLWDIETGRELQQFIGHTEPAVVEFSPDGRYIVTASDEGTARVWDVQTGLELRRFSHSDIVYDAKISPDSQYLLTGSHDNTARLWDIQSGLELRRFIGHTDNVNGVSFSPDGRYALTSSADKTARLWDVETGHEVRRFIGHTHGIEWVAFSPDGQYVLTGSRDRTARLWDVWLETEPRNLDLSTGGAHGIARRTAAISSDGQRLLIGGTVGIVRLLDVASGTLLQEIETDSTGINTYAFSSDNRYVLAGSIDGIARLWEAETGQEIQKFKGHTGPILDIAFSPDGQTILTGSEDKSVRLWDAETGQEISQFSGHSEAVQTVAFSPDGRTILTGSEDQTARLWNVETGQETRQFVGHTGPVLGVAFSPDGHFILTAGSDAAVRLWETETGQEIRRFTGHTDQVSQVTFSPDGRFALTGSADQTARLWDVETGQIVRQFSGHVSSLLVVGFSKDGQQVFTADSEAAYTWRATLASVIEFTCAQLFRDLTAEERALYNIAATTPTCTEFAERSAEPEPTWTPIPTRAVPVTSLNLAPVDQPGEQVVEMEFLSESANVQMGLPVQEVYVDVGNGQVRRVEILNAQTLALPVYRSAVEVALDFLEPPFDTGPYPKGEPLGFTLADYVAATGSGTYKVQGNRARIDLTFDKLVPNGVYTVWCNEFTLPPNTKMVELPCGAADGSENTFMVDEQGHGEIIMEIEAFPRPTEETFYEIAIAYHSDGQTHGSSVGAHGLNAHGQMYFDFLPPAE